MISILQSLAGDSMITARAPGINQQHSEVLEPIVVSAEHGYELWAQSYDQDPNPLLALEERLVMPMLPDLTGSSVVDVACGTGRWLKNALLRGAASATGIDCSPAMLAVAGRKPLLRGRLVQADCFALPLHDSVADLVVCSFAIGHLREIEELAGEVARVARPNAPVFVSGLHPEARRRGWRTCFRSHSLHVEINTYCHSLTDIRDAFSARGLELVESVEGRLGEPERPIFVRSGRLDYFQQVTHTPAIFVSQFRRTNPARRRYKAR